MNRIILAVGLSVLSLFSIFVAPAQAAVTPTKCDSNVCASINTVSPDSGVQVTGVNVCNGNSFTIKNATVAFYGTGGNGIYGQSLGTLAIGTCVAYPVPNVQMGRAACAEFHGLRSGVEAFNIRMTVGSGDPC